MLKDFLLNEVGMRTITAHVMVNNAASARVLEKSGFIRTARGVEEDWGYEQPAIADKWFC